MAGKPRLGFFWIVDNRLFPVIVQYSRCVSTALTRDHLVNQRFEYGYLLANGFFGDSRSWLPADYKQTLHGRIFYWKYRRCCQVNYNFRMTRQRKATGFLAAVLSIGFCFYPHSHQNLQISAHQIAYPQFIGCLKQFIQILARLS
jgi:hypothetical protein